MAQDLSRIEQMQPLDVRRPAKLSSLPEWAELLCNTLRVEFNQYREGKCRTVARLPRSMMPSETQRGLITRHVSALDSILMMTPEADYSHAEHTVTAISKMLLALPSREAGEFAAEAKSEAYMAALDDVPFWAVNEAMRRWYRGECGPKFDYRWQPAPATLRELATAEAFRVQAVRRQLHQIVTAEPEVEFDEDHARRMREKLIAAGILSKKDAVA